jgi:hypothetical protein
MGGPVCGPRAARPLRPADVSALAVTLAVRAFAPGHACSPAVTWHLACGIVREGWIELPCTGHVNSGVTCLSLARDACGRLLSAHPAIARPWHRGLSHIEGVTP